MGQAGGTDDPLLVADRRRQQSRLGVAVRDSWPCVHSHIPLVCPLHQRTWDSSDDLMNPQVSVGARRHTCVHHVLAAPGNARNESLHGGNTRCSVWGKEWVPVSHSILGVPQEQRKNEPINWRSIFQVYWRKLLGTCSTWFLLDSVLYANGYVTMPLYTTTPLPHRPTAHCASPVRVPPASSRARFWKRRVSAATTARCRS